MDQLLAMRAFVRIVETGSFARAADGLNLPRSSVSKLLQDLEHHLSVRLVSRTTRAVTVTPEGSAYYDRTIRLLGDIEESDSEARAAASQPRGRLRVDVGSSLANLVLVPALADFRERFPEVDLIVGVSDRPADLIEDGIDCVIRGGQLLDSSLIARHLCTLDYVTCATPAYFATRSLPLSPNDLHQGHLAVTYLSASTGKPFPLRFCVGAEPMELTIRAGASLNESTAHLTALVSGLGIGQTFRFMAKPHLESGGLLEVLSDYAPALYPMHLVFPQRRQLSARLRAFADWASQAFAKIDSGLG